MKSEDREKSFPPAPLPPYPLHSPHPTLHPHPHTHHGQESHQAWGQRKLSQPENTGPRVWISLAKACFGIQEFRFLLRPGQNAMVLTLMSEPPIPAASHTHTHTPHTLHTHGAFHCALEKSFEVEFSQGLLLFSFHLQLCLLRAQP